MSEHTPGPWVADDNEGFSMWKIYSRMSPSGSGIQGPCVAEVIGDSAEADANANLIAAAPEMLEALKMFLEYNDQGGPLSFNTDAMWAQARAAIAKAEGKEMP